MDHSISDDSLRRFAQGTASPEEGRSIVTHLAKGCAICAKRVKSFARPDIPAGAYDAIFARLETVKIGAADSQMASSLSRQLLTELKAEPEKRQELLVRNSRRFQTAEMAELLRQFSYSLRYKDTLKMVHYARLGVLIAELLTANGPEEHARVADLRALCLVQLGNAYRVCGDLDTSDRVTTTAQSWQRRGTGDPAVRARVYDRLAATRAAQYRFAEAEQLYAQAVEIWRDLGNPHMLAEVLVGQAIAVGFGGDPESALSLLLEAMPKIDGARDPRLTLVACHNVILFQIEAGKVEDASHRWIELRSLYHKIGDPLLCVRATELEGKLMVAQGLISPGTRLLEEARVQYLRRGLDYEAAQASLEMARGLYRLGRGQEVRKLLSEILPVFRVRRVDRRVLATVVLLEKASARGTVSESFQ